MPAPGLAFTVLPRGVPAPGPDGGRRLAASIAVTCTASGPGATRLADMPVLADWPGHSPSLTLELQDGPKLPVTLTGPKPSAELWTALLPPDTPPPSAGSTRPTAVSAFPGLAVTRLAKSLLLQAAAQGARRLAVHDLLDAHFGLLPLVQRRAAGQPLAAARLPAVMAQPRALAPAALVPSAGTGPAAAADGQALDRAMSFMAAAGASGRARAGIRPAPAAAPVTSSAPDLLARLAALRGFPEILRRLGLLIDVAVTLPAGFAPEKALVRVLADWPTSLAAADRPVVVSPWTAAVLTTGSFAAQRRQPAPAEGIVDLSHASVGLEFLDATGAAHDFDALARRLVAALAANETTVAAPRLRSSGISLHFDNAEQRAGERMQQASQAEAAARGAVSQDPSRGIQLFAEDLVRGYRVDIWNEQAKTWRSVCQREATYALAPAASAAAKAALAGLQPFLDEGAVVRGGTVANDTMQISDVLFRWDGWSLVIPRPDAELTDQPVTQGQPGAADPHALQVTGTPPRGSLPLLRFGQSYRFRVREVDLGGGGPAPSAGANADLPGASATVSFARVESLSPPVVLRTTTPGPGETTHRLALRDGGGAAALVVLPPAATLRAAELHGCADANGRPDANQLAALEKRLPNSGVEPPTMPKAAFAQLPSALRTNADTTVGWIPDPDAARAALWLLPADGDPAELGEPMLIDFGKPGAGAWPGGIQGFTVRIEPAVSGKAALAQARGGAVVSLPPGTIVRLRLASVPAVLDRFVIDQWQIQAAPQNHASWQAEALKGKLAMLSPPRDLTLVHAVQTPVSPGMPGVTLGQRKAAVATAKAGEPTATDIALTAIVTADAATTAEVTLQAVWKDIVDDGVSARAPAPGEDQVRTVGKATVPLGAGQTQVVFQKPVFDPHDGKARRVRFRVVASNRFGDMLATAKPITGPDSAEQMVLACVPPRAPLVYEVIPSFEWQSSGNPPGPVSRVRRGGMRVWLGRPWYGSGEGEQLAVVLADPAAANRDQQPVVSIWGRDRLAGAAPTNGWFVPKEAFRNPGALVQARVSLNSDSAIPVHALLFDVSYDPVSERYFADIPLDAPPGVYGPLVRLMFARANVNAVAGCTLSPVVAGPFVALPAERTLTVARNQDSVTVTVAGGAWPGGGTLGLSSSFHCWDGAPNPEGVSFQLWDGSEDKLWTGSTAMSVSANNHLQVEAKLTLPHGARRAIWVLEQEAIGSWVESGSASVPETQPNRGITEDPLQPVKDLGNPIETTVNPADDRFKIGQVIHPDVMTDRGATEIGQMVRQTDVAHGMTQIGRARATPVAQIAKMAKMGEVLRQQPLAGAALAVGQAAGRQAVRAEAISGPVNIHLVRQNWSRVTYVDYIEI